MSTRDLVPYDEMPVCPTCGGRIVTGYYLPPDGEQQLCPGHPES